MTLTRRKIVFAAAASLSHLPTWLLPAQDGAAARRRTFDARLFDYAAHTGPRVDTARLHSYPSERPFYVNSRWGNLRRLRLTAEGGSERFLEIFIGTAAGWRAEDVSIFDCKLNVPLKIDTQSDSPYRLDIAYSWIRPGLDAQLAMGAVTAALGGVQGSLRHVRVEAAVDSVFAGGSTKFPTVIDKCWLRAQRSYPYTDGFGWDRKTRFPLAPGVSPLNASARKSLTPTEQRAAGMKLWQPSNKYRAGDLVRVRVSPQLGNWVIQCVSPGLAGSGVAVGQPLTPAGLPGGIPLHAGIPLRLKDADSDPSFVLTGGTARWVVVGTSLHSDGLQLIGGGNVTLERSRVEGANNLLVLVQSFADVGRRPCTAVVIRENLFVMSKFATFALMVNSNASLDGALSGLLGGPVLRIGKGVWRTAPDISRSRPLYVTIQDNFFHPASSSQNNHLISTGSVYGDDAIFVQSEEERDKAVAEQFGISPDRAARMRTEAPYAFNSQVPSRRVLERRLMMFERARPLPNFDGAGHQGKCDARTWIVWSGNRYARNGLIAHPNSGWAGRTGFDANGYFIGG